MYGVSIVNIHAAGGVIRGGRQDFVFIGGNPWSVVGDSVEGHGEPPHNSPVMAEGSGFITINNIKACREENRASCGHMANGSDFFFVSG